MVNATTIDELPGTGAARGLERNDGAGPPPTADTAVPSPDRPARRRASSRRWWYRGAAAAILVLAGIVRILPVGASLPYPGAVDEAHTLHHGADMALNATTDPRWYDYPTLPIALAAAIIEVAEVPSSDAKRNADLSFTAYGDVYDDVRPSRALIGSRLATAVFSVGTVLLVMVAATWLARRRVALAAGLIAAVAPALVQRGLFDLVDTMATFFVAAAFVAGLAAARSSRRSRRIGWSVVAGACAGLAAGSKYPSGAALAMVLVLVAVACRGSIAKRALRAGLAVLAAAVAFVGTMPAVIGNRAAVIDAVTVNYDRYATKVFADTYWSGALRVTEVGVALLVAAAIGVVVLLYRRGTRIPTVAWLAYAVILTAVAARLPFQPFRNLLSIIPFLCIGAAVGIDAVVRAVGDRLAGGHRRLADVAFAAVVVALAVQLTVGGVRPYLDVARRPDSRVEARDWLVANVQPGDTIVVMGELAMTKPELDRIPASVVVESAIDGSVTRDDGEAVPGGRRYVVTGRLKGEDAPWLPELAVGPVARFGVRPVTTIGLTQWRGNDALVDIYVIPG